MKKITFLILLSSFLLAELPPRVYESMKEVSPEILKIKVLYVSKGVFSSQVDVTAKVVSVGRTSSELKIGDKINIKYHRENRPAGWVGPSSPWLVEENKEYMSFLKCKDKKCSIAAKGKSFQSGNYYGKILEPQHEREFDFD